MSYSVIDGLVSNIVLDGKILCGYVMCALHNVCNHNGEEDCEELGRFQRIVRKYTVLRQHSPCNCCCV